MPFCGAHVEANGAATHSAAQNSALRKAIGAQSLMRPAEKPHPQPEGTAGGRMTNAKAYTAMQAKTALADSAAAGQRLCMADQRAPAPNTEQCRGQSRG
ncbi:MAG: hypothetical protein EDM82_01675 [Cyanobacteria bacterium CYA]|nr:MAG: hypothetical protein EDM82_01675 [Cyanobacteria bacterium CYA]